MNQPDLFRAIIAATLVDNFHKNDPGYKPLLPTGNSEQEDKLPDPSNPYDPNYDPYHIK
jgi:hypothetical protein